MPTPDRRRPAALKTLAPRSGSQLPQIREDPAGYVFQTLTRLPLLSDARQDACLISPMLSRLSGDAAASRISVTDRALLARLAVIQ